MISARSELEYQIHYLDKVREILFTLQFCNCVVLKLIALCLSYASADEVCLEMIKHLLGD